MEASNEDNCMAKILLVHESNFSGPLQLYNLQSMSDLDMRFID